MHGQGAFEETDSVRAACPVTERHCRKVLSFPMPPNLTEDDIAGIERVFF